MFDEIRPVEIQISAYRVYGKDLGHPKRNPKKRMFSDHCAYTPSDERRCPLFAVALSAGGGKIGNVVDAERQEEPHTRVVPRRIHRDDVVDRHVLRVDLFTAVDASVSSKDIRLPLAEISSSVIGRPGIPFPVDMDFVAIDRCEELNPRRVEYADLGYVCAWSTPCKATEYESLKALFRRNNEFCYQCISSFS